MKKPLHSLEAWPLSTSEGRSHGEKPIFSPGKYADGIGGFSVFVPTYLHARLSAQAEAEGVPISALVVEFLDKGLTLRRSHVLSPTRLAR